MVLCVHSITRNRILLLVLVLILLSILTGEYMHVVYYICARTLHVIYAYSNAVSVHLHPCIRRPTAMRARPAAYCASSIGK